MLLGKLASENVLGWERWAIFFIVMDAITLLQHAACKQSKGGKLEVDISTTYVHTCVGGWLEIVLETSKALY